MTPTDHFLVSKIEKWGLRVEREHTFDPQQIRGRPALVPGIFWPNPMRFFFDPKGKNWDFWVEIF